MFSTEASLCGVGAAVGRSSIGRLVITDYFLPSSIADRLKKLRVRYPHLRLHVSVRKSMQIESGADSGDFDIGLSMRILDGRSLPEGLPVRREALRWVSVAGFEVEREENTPLPLLVLPQGCSLQRLARETLEAHEVPYVVAHSASGVAGLQSALLAGLGVACLNASAVPMGAKVCQSAQHLPGLPDVEFSLLPPRPGEFTLGRGRQVNACEPVQLIVRRASSVARALWGRCEMHALRQGLALRFGPVSRNS